MNMALKIFQQYGEWIWRLVILAAVCANLWLTTHFVTREEYEKFQKELRAEMIASQTQNAAEHYTIQTAISDINTTLKIMAANQVQLQDHEQRLRACEAKQIDVISRVTSVEKIVDKLP